MKYIAQNKQPGTSWVLKQQMGLTKLCTALTEKLFLIYDEYLKIAAMVYYTVAQRENKYAELRGLQKLLEGKGKG